MLFCKTSNVVNAYENVGGIFRPIQGELYCFVGWDVDDDMNWWNGKEVRTFFSHLKKSAKKHLIFCYIQLGVNNLGGALKFPPFIQHHHFADHRAHKADDMNGHKTSRKNRKLIVLPYKNEIALFNRCGVLFHKMFTKPHRKVYQAKSV